MDEKSDGFVPQDLSRPIRACFATESILRSMYARKSEMRGQSSVKKRVQSAQEAPRSRTKQKLI